MDNLVKPKFLKIEGKSIPNAAEIPKDTLALVFDEEWRNRFENENYKILDGSNDRYVTIWVDPENTDHTEFL
jgi:hypothetical protein